MYNTNQNESDARKFIDHTIEHLGITVVADILTHSVATFTLIADSLVGEHHEVVDWREKYTNKNHN